MVLRKERQPSDAGSTNKMSSANEQPVLKRQRIDNASENDENETESDSSSSTSSLVKFQDGVVVIGGSATGVCVTSGGVSGTDELDRATISIDAIENKDLMQAENGGDKVEVPLNQDFGTDNDMEEFQSYLIKQCLCGVSERSLRKPFQSHYNHDVNGTKRIAKLIEWPHTKLMQFLSNLELLFEIYLKQNQKGLICVRIMDVCDALKRNEHNLIDEIIELCDYNNKFVTFLAGRVLSSFLVISKDTMNSNWLENIVNNLFLFETLDFVAVRKISFSLDIIKRIVEWKDIEVHPLDECHEDTVEGSRRMDEGGGTSGGGHFVPNQVYTPTLENNYFAQYYSQSTVAGPSSSSGGSVSTHASSVNNSISLNNSSSRISNPTTSSSSLRDVLQQTTTLTPPSPETECHIVTLTDSESFDTTHLKCVTIKILENKWPALVKNMSTLILSSRNIHTAENCITTFLTLWESIISVRTNLSVVETLPFYAQLDKFEALLSQQLSCTVYKQMLTLFNEALCYGSTLALQDLLPEETCSLAHQIVRHVKDFRILESLPRRHPENQVGLIEYIGPSITYGDENFALVSPQSSLGDDTFESIDMDKTLLQKIVLLVLKSVAVTVKEIRSDSSDSSIDSTDYEAFQDMVLIERSIRDVLKKLESFLKNTLEFHPESHFSKMLIYLFDDQDDYLIEAMVCTLDVTAGISFRNNEFPELAAMLNPVYTFLEFLKMISNSSDLLLDLLVSNETCFLLYLLRFLKYIQINWSMFIKSCWDFGNVLEDSMSVLIRLRLQISRLVSKSLYPYDISPILRLLESCENKYEGNELS